MTIGTSIWALEALTPSSIATSLTSLRFRFRTAGPRSSVDFILWAMEAANYINHGERLIVASVGCRHNGYLEIAYVAKMVFGAQHACSRERIYIASKALILFIAVFLCIVVLPLFQFPFRKWGMHVKFPKTLQKL